MSELPASLSVPRRLAARLPVSLFAPRAWFVAYAAWLALLFLLSSLPGTDAPRFPTHTDKVAHFLYFAAGGFTLATALSLRRPALGRAALPAFTLAAGALVGLLDEWHQTFTDFRNGLDPGDWIADVLGSSAGLVASGVTLRWLRTQGTAPSPPS